jgi:hypothetical protein
MAVQVLPSRPCKLSTPAIALSHLNNCLNILIAVDRIQYHWKWKSSSDPGDIMSEAYRHTDMDTVLSVSLWLSQCETIPGRVGSKTWAAITPTIYVHWSRNRYRKCAASEKNRCPINSRSLLLKSRSIKVQSIWRNLFARNASASKCQKGNCYRALLRMRELWSCYLGHRTWWPKTLRGDFWDRFSSFPVLFPEFQFQRFDNEYKFSLFSVCVLSRWCVNGGQLLSVSVILCSEVIR